jgi:hypothetical protein
MRSIKIIKQENDGSAPIGHRSVMKHVPQSSDGAVGTVLMAVLSGSPAQSSLAQSCSFKQARSATTACPSTGCSAATVTTANNSSTGVTTSTNHNRVIIIIVMAGFCVGRCVLVLAPNPVVYRLGKEIYDSPKWSHPNYFIFFLVF